MAGDTHKLRLRDGRDLAYCEFGAADGHPVFYAHGSPGSRLEGAMYHEKAVEYGFRLPSALDNRPLNFDEFMELSLRMLFVSATPGKMELQLSEGVVVEQIIRPTGLKT